MKMHGLAEDDGREQGQLHAAAHGSRDHHHEGGHRQERPDAVGDRVRELLAEAVVLERARAHGTLLLPPEVQRADSGDPIGAS